jgi:predicted acylesterase/phospholipase RssA
MATTDTISASAMPAESISGAVQKPTPDSAFERIALGLSGGGFRAAAYGLGTLNALHLLGLLDNVHQLSTVSGGTFAGAFYALRRKQGQNFETIYTDFRARLASDTLLPNALTRWKKAIGKTGANYKLIRAFADTYNADFFDKAGSGAFFGAFWEADTDLEKPFHIQSLIFNSTELYSGLTFRFQHAAFLADTMNDPDEGPRPAYFIGNGNVHISPDVAKTLRLADVVAATSCFPGGFEPLVMPDDFPMPDTRLPILLNRAGDQLMNEGRTAITRLALLDGGIYDNQGIESLLTANRRNLQYIKSNNPAYNLLTSAQQKLLQPSTMLLIADVASAGLNLYDAPGPGPVRDSTRSLRQWGGVWRTVQWGCLAVLMLMVLVMCCQGRGSFGAGLLAGISLVGLGITLAGQWAWSKINSVFKEKAPDIQPIALPPLLRLSLPQLWYLLKVRVDSLMSLLLDIFLRRVRSQNYGQVFSNDDDNELVKTMTVVPSIIGGIVRDYKRPHQPVPGKKSVRDELAAVYKTVLEASEMGTTLWWLRDKDRLQLIIASAEITLCYRLLLRFEKYPPVVGGKGEDVQRRAQLIWDAYQQKDRNFWLPPALANIISNTTCTAGDLIREARKYPQPN